MDPLESWALLPRIVVTIAVGRLVLHLLPAGEPGSGRIRGWPGALGASITLGAMTLHAQALLVEHSKPASLLLPWLLLALGVWFALPGRLIPRHEVQDQSDGVVAGLLRTTTLFALVLACLLRSRTGPDSDANVLHLMLEGAALLSLTSAARGLRVRADLSWALALVGAAHLLVHDSAVPALDQSFPVAAAALGVEGLVRWTTCADRRGRALAVSAGALHALAAPGPLAVPLALAAGVALATGPARRHAALKEAALLGLLGIGGFVFEKWNASRTDLSIERWVAALVVLLLLERATRSSVSLGRQAESSTRGPIALLASGLILIVLEALGHSLVGHFPAALPALLLLALTALGRRTPHAAYGPWVDLRPVRSAGSR